jgi:hypothetical protein
MFENYDDLAECVHTMLKRHGAGAQNIARTFALTHQSAGNKEMASFWIAVCEAIQREVAAVVH